MQVEILITVQMFNRSSAVSWCLCSISSSSRGKIIFPSCSVSYSSFRIYFTEPRNSRKEKFPLSLNKTDFRTNKNILVFIIEKASFGSETVFFSFLLCWLLLLFPPWLMWISQHAAGVRCTVCGVAGAPLVVSGGYYNNTWNRKYKYMTVNVFFRYIVGLWWFDWFDWFPALNTWRGLFSLPLQTAEMLHTDPKRFKYETVWLKDTWFFRVLLTDTMSHNALHKRNGCWDRNISGNKTKIYS